MMFTKIMVVPGYICTYIGRWMMMMIYRPMDDDDDDDDDSSDVGAAE